MKTDEAGYGLMKYLEDTRYDEVLEYVIVEGDTKTWKLISRVTRTYEDKDTTVFTNYVTEANTRGELMNIRDKLEKQPCP